MILFYSFLALNLIAFILMGYDKNAAKNHKSRISEQTLLIFVGLGGTIGSGLGMLVFRHKTRKKSYRYKFWILFGTQLLIAFFYFKN